MVINIKELVIGNTVRGLLLIKTATIRRTKAGKAYLQMELTDGTNTIGANNWDWTEDSAPAPSTIYCIEATVSDWQGNKQLNVVDMYPSADQDTTPFMPQGEVDIEATWNTFLHLCDSIENAMLRRLVKEVTQPIQQKLKQSPAAVSVHHAYIGGLLEHTVSTAIKAKVLAEYTHQCNIDLCVVGALLHDIGKINAYCINNVVIEETEIGIIVGHLVEGTRLLEPYRTSETGPIIDLLQHIILSHHGQLEYGSPVTPKFIEAWVVHCADMIDAKAQTIMQINSDCNIYKDWTLGGKMISQKYIQEVLNECTK